MSVSQEASKDRLPQLLYRFLGSENRNEEFEIRFGTKGIHRISKVDFDHVVQYLLSKQFRRGYERQTLKVRNEFITKQGKMVISNLRTEINNSLQIQKYCKANHIVDDDKNIIPGTEFIQKTGKRVNDALVRPVDFDDFNFRATWQDERKLTTKSPLVQQVINDWRDKKKIFRLITRYTFTHPDYPGIKVDMSLVKGSKVNKRGNMIPTYNIQESNVFDGETQYEIEIEVEKSRNASVTNDMMLANLRAVIKYVLSGLQKSNYPIPYTKMRSVATEYMKMIHGEDHEVRRILAKHFVGPSSISLELKNIQPLEEDSSVPNIHTPYTVTDKADGTRKLLFVDGKGMIYFFDVGMNVQFTGMRTASDAHWNSILDGEHIMNDKHGTYINMYAAFDIYFIDGEDQRSKAFVNHKTDDTDKTMFRLNQLANFLRSFNAVPVAKTAHPLVFERKVFEISPNPATIYSTCAKIFKRIDSETYPYETDGLIFTPCEYGVGLGPDQTEVFNTKHTWTHSFKWKPPEFNTIDFLVTTKKDQVGKEIVSYVFEDGKDLSSTSPISEYKTLILRVGYDEKKHGIMQPCKDLIDDTFTKRTSEDKTADYKPVPFYPTQPSVDKAYLCNLMLRETGLEKHMMTENGEEAIEDETIVEFRYDKSRSHQWKWVPIRVRHDKTAEYRAGQRNYGNAYHVAQSVWSSIHHPITKNMLMTGEDIPDEANVYSQDSAQLELVAPLTDFNRKYVRRALLGAVSERGKTLFDTAVGHAEDAPLWIEDKLKFIYGVDNDKSAIEHRLNGACANYIRERENYKRSPAALFSYGNMQQNLRDGTGFFSDRNKQTMTALTGRGTQDKKTLGDGVYKQFGIAEEGFDITACFNGVEKNFENLETLQEYLANLSENTKNGGYVVGTCIDGGSIFRAFADREVGYSIDIMKGDTNVWSIRKSYRQTTFDANNSSLGLAVDVNSAYTNGDTYRNYLVQFDYFVQVMEMFGFVLVTGDHAKHMGLGNSNGTWNDLHYQMRQELDRESQTRKRKNTLKSKIGDAIDLEDDVALMGLLKNYRYFVFQKVNHVDSREMKNLLIRTSEEMEQELEKKLTEESIRREIEAVKEDDEADTVVEKKISALKEADDAEDKVEETLIRIPRVKKVRKLKKKLTITE